MSVRVDIFEGGFSSLKGDGDDGRKVWKIWERHIFPNPLVRRIRLKNLLLGRWKKASFFHLILESSEKSEERVDIFV